MVPSTSLLLVQAALSFYIEPSPHNEHVIEQSIMSISDIASLEKNSSFSNVRKIGNGVVLRSSDGKGSLINLNEKIASDNWSAEFVVKNLVLKDVERVGMYLWYTEKRIESGSYKGGDSVFNGFVLGVEFSQDRAELAFSFNYGLDFSRKDIQSTRHDRINPSLIDHLDHFRVKVIHTEKNFKIELFDDKGSLISDSFRIHEPLIMNRGNNKKNFAITTTYENTPADVYLELRDFKAHAREETEKYDYRDLHTEHNSFPRNKSDEELRMAVADIDHFLDYVTVVLGSGKQNSIVQATVEVKKKTRLIKDNLDSMISTAKEVSRISLDALETEKSSKIGELEQSLNDILLKTEKYRLRLKEIGSRSSSPKASSIVLVSGMVFLMVIAAKTVAGKLLGRVKSSKKE